jgi:hypothetical protein
VEADRTFSSDDSSQFTRELWPSESSNPMDFTFNSNGFHFQLQWISFSTPMDFTFKSNGFHFQLQWISLLNPMDFTTETDLTCFEDGVGL